MISKVKNSIQALRDAPVEISQSTEPGSKGRNSERRAGKSGLSSHGSWRGEQSRESGEGYRLKASTCELRESTKLANQAKGVSMHFSEVEREPPKESELPVTTGLG